MRDYFRILLSGPGLIGAQHAQLVSARNDCKLAAIVVPDTGRHSETACEFGANLYSTIEHALANENFDAAIISSPNAFHFVQTMKCIKSGIPVLVEKPLTNKTYDARVLVDEVEKLQIPVLVGHHRTYSPLLNAAESFLNSPKFGRLVAVQGSALFLKPTDYFTSGVWRTKEGGGPILINLIHEIGILRHFCGEIKSVFAFASHTIRNFDVEDTVVISFEFVNGALGSFLLSDTAASSKNWEMTSGENPAYPHFPTEFCYHFVGTNGSLDFPNMSARYYSNADNASWWKPFEKENIEFEPVNPLERQLAHFIDVVSGKVAPLVSARDGYRNMLVLDAIAASIKKQAKVGVNLIEPGAVVAN